MRISDWSSDVCSSDLPRNGVLHHGAAGRRDTQGLRSSQIHIRKRLAARHVLAAEDALAKTIGQAHLGQLQFHQIGSASCRERVCQYVKISVVAVSLKKQKQIGNMIWTEQR